MPENEGLKENEKSKSRINKVKQKINSEKEKSKKNAKIEREKEKNNKKIKEKYENYSYNGEKKQQSKDSLITNNIIKRKKILVNKDIKLQKTAEKKSCSETHINRLEKKSIYHYFKLWKKWKIWNISKKFRKKKNCESDVECHGTDYQNQKFSKKFVNDSEKNEISKSAETSINKIKLKTRKEKFCNYAKEGKNIKEKNNMNDNLEEDRFLENESKNNYSKILIIFPFNQGKIFYL